MKLAVLTTFKTEEKAKTTSTKSLSVVIPVFNEEENIDALCSKTIAALNQLGHPWEVIFIDDGSTDSSYIKLVQIATGKSTFLNRDRQVPRQHPLRQQQHPQCLPLQQEPLYL